MPSTTDISYRILIVVCIVLHQSISGQRQWLPFGENNMKPLPGMPIASGLDQKDVDAAEFFSPRDNESALAYAPETSRKFLPKCGETPPIAIEGTKYTVEPGLLWSAVLISNDVQYRCGATFISLRHLLTAASCIRLLPTTNLGDPVGFGLYWAVNCNFLIAESYPELCAKSVPVRSARLKLRLGYYVYNVTDAYLNSADNYLEDVAILELFKSVNPDKWPARLACVPKPEDVFEQSKDGPPFTLVAKRATKHSSKFVGTYEKLDLTEVAAPSAGGDDVRQAELCENFEDKIKCIVVPYGAGDFWLLPGVGVFSKVKGSDKWHLYGHVIEVLAHTEGKQYHVVIRLVQSLLTHICYYAGVCATEELQENSGNATLQNIVFDRFYLPKYHNGTQMWKTPEVSLPQENEKSAAGTTVDVNVKSGDGGWPPSLWNGDEGYLQAI